ncbi:signal peptidase II [Chelativorans intermedius]|uniref:Lipoprotein signal peptidase n=1 Tax=Chelativorans intermedius TaxID=515947 RepID=A0ABV6DCD4_9HYPH|nr:signal peptidase II [Chelativorans intermedius]MCT9000042.1 signal peptidase II [Chelativorans intermedius]
MNRRAMLLYGGTMLVALLLDQAVKALVEAGLALHERVDVLPFLALLHSRNTGIAFSLFSGVDGVWLSLAVLVIIVFIATMAVRTGPQQVFARFGFALIIGGALGNLIDRAVRGHVVDYVFFHTPVWSFAIFNLADAFITIGAGLVILDEWIAWRRSRREGRG